MTTPELDPWSLPTYPERIALTLSLLDTHRCAVPTCARVITTAGAILRADTPGQPGPLHPANERTEGETVGAPRRPCVNTVSPPGRLAPIATTIGADLMMVAPADPVHADCQPRHAEDAATIRQLRADLNHVRALLVDAIHAREGLVQANIKLHRRSVHWFVDDPTAHGCCAACALPETNARHAKRAA